MAIMSLGSLLTRKVADLSLDDVQSVANALGKGQVITEEQKNLALSILQAQNIDKVSDILARPEIMEQLKTFLKPPGSEPLGIIQCPHCLATFLMEPQR